MMRSRTSNRSSFLNLAFYSRCTALSLNCYPREKSFAQQNASNTSNNYKRDRGIYSSRATASSRFFFSSHYFRHAFRLSQLSSMSTKCWRERETDLASTLSFPSHGFLVDMSNIAILVYLCSCVNEHALYSLGISGCAAIAYSSWASRERE